MHTQCHIRDWLQCQVKRKCVKVQYICVHDASKTSGCMRHPMSFYKELSCFHATNRAIATAHNFGTTREEEEWDKGPSVLGIERT